MTKIGIISGGGKLPYIIGKNLINKNFEVVFFLLEENVDCENYKDLDFIKINLKSIKKIIDLLKLNKIDKILLAGSINRPSISDISFDFQTIKLAKDLLLNNYGDNQLLESIKLFLNKNGFEYFDWTTYCSDLFVNDKHLTLTKPSTNAKKNLKKALDTFKVYGKLDIGQSIIVQNQIILGLEAVEGTDRLIIRCNELKKKGDKGILVKFSKYNQSKILDIPTIGEQTILLLKKNNYEGIFIEKNNCLIIDKTKTIDLANQNKIFISTCDKIE